MTLARVWIPSGNYSGGGTKRLLVIHTMEGFTGANGAYDCAKYFQGNVGASSQVCIDNNRGKIWECVTRNNSSWTQCNFNSVSVSAEQSGYASWSRDYWLANRENELRNTAEWIAEEAKKFGIPIRALTASEAQGGGKGICQHMNLGSSGCAHSDCGPNYPIDKVIEWAKGGGTAPESTGEMSSDIAFYDGKEYIAYINPSGRVCVNGGVVDSGSNAKSGVGIDINQDTGRKVVTYINTSSRVCTYTQNVGDNKWYWADKKWSAKLSVRIESGGCLILLWCWEQPMAECGRKSFDAEWEAKLWMLDHPWPEPSPPLHIVQCHHCRKYHISDRLPGSKRRRRKQNGR